MTEPLTTGDDDTDTDAAILFVMAKNNELLAELLEKVELAIADLDGLRHRVEAIEDRHTRLDESLLVLQRQREGES
jgi:hypothetical protein